MVSYDDEMCYYKNGGFIITGISELERQQEKSRLFPLFLREWLCQEEVIK